MFLGGSLGNSSSVRIFHRPPGTVCPAGRWECHVGSPVSVLFLKDDKASIVFEEFL